MKNSLLVMVAMILLVPLGLAQGTFDGTYEEDHAAGITEWCVDVVGTTAEKITAVIINGNEPLAENRYNASLPSGKFTLTFLFASDIPLNCTIRVVGTTSGGGSHEVTITPGSCEPN